ncbi:Biofilm growth-associated repressor [subsurface metagenome]
MATQITGDTLDKAAALLKAFAHHDRFQIVNVFTNDEFHVGELTKLLGTRQSHTSQQLSILKLAGVLKSRRDGNKTYYSLANDSIKKIVKSIIADI